MKFLVDTNVLLRLLAHPEKIRNKVLNELKKPTNEVLVSAASAWEIAIKAAIGKLVLPEDARTFIPRRIGEMGLQELPVSVRHALGAGDLSMLHNDPFVRLLVAQARAEAATLVTTDRLLAKYPVTTLLA